MARQVLENGVILPAEYSDDWYDDMTSNLTKLDDVIGSDSEKLSSADVGAAALSNSYNDLDNLPTIPTVNDATLTIQKNGVDVQTFTANASSNVTCNITVPTKTSDLTNDSNFVDTTNSAVASGITSAKVTSYDNHIADTDIHVTATDKNKWNNGVSQSYVLRYSSSSVTDNSTIAYSTLDNTDNIKAGDKVIDSDGKIFSIVSVDTANQTVTVGSALIDLALDANVVHTSGNETVGGLKIFSSGQIGVGRDLYLLTPNSYSKNTPPANTSYQYVWFGGNTASQGFTDSWYSGYLEQVMNTNGSARGRWFIRDKSESSLGIELFVDGSTKQFRPQVNNNTDLGTSKNKWKSFNGLEPSSLSLPDLSNGIDISSYITLPNTHNTYTPSVNGWISIILKSTSGALGLFIYQGDLSSSQYSSTSLPNESEPCVMCCLPVVGNTAVSIDTKGSNAYVVSAKFFPCQGNV